MTEIGGKGLQKADNNGKKQTPRQLCLSLLLKTELMGAYSNIALDKAFSSTDISVRDRAFAAALFYGTLEKKLLLDYNLSLVSDTPINRLQPEVLTILRMGAYQIFFMDSVPSPAAVSESVDLCRRFGAGEASGFINGVLRALCRNTELRLPNPKKGKNKYFSIKYSCPETIVRLWREGYGDDTALKILQSLYGRPAICARVNTLKTDAHSLIDILSQKNIKAEAHRYIKDALLISGTGNIRELDSYKKGLFHIQDAASQLCCMALDCKSGQTVTDMCAAPGGKSFTIAEYMGNTGSILSCDLYESRLSLIKSGSERLGIDIISTKAADSSKSEGLMMSDRILCDVPCSGLGIIRRKPELRYKTELGTDTLPQLQYEILCNSSHFLKSGGVLVYSTCTLNPSENHGVVKRFLCGHSDFKPGRLKLPEGIKRQPFDAENELTLIPGEYDSDGFFISVLTKV